MLAATCSRIDENDAQQQQQISSLDLNSVQLTQGANGWQMVPVGAQINLGNDKVLTQKNPETEAPQQQFLLSPTTALQNPSVLSVPTLSGVLPNIQYQLIPQFTTIDNQQLHFSQTSHDVSAAGTGQIQLLSANGSQPLITTAANQSAGSGNILTMPGVIPLHNFTLGNSVLTNQTPFINMPLALNNITLLPVSTGSNAAKPDDVSTSNQQLVHNQATSIVTTSESVGNTHTLSTHTPTASSYMEPVSLPNSSMSVNTFQNVTAGISVQSDSRATQQQQILIQPQQLLQNTSALQTLQSGALTTGHVISADGLQNLQFQSLNNGPILLRTVGPNGQVSWQTLQLQSPAGAQITLASLPALASPTTINLNSTGLQLNQLQEVPITGN